MTFRLGVFSPRAIVFHKGSRLIMRNTHFYLRINQNMGHSGKIISGKIFLQMSVPGFGQILRDFRKKQNLSVLQKILSLTRLLRNQALSTLRQKAKTLRLSRRKSNPKVRPSDLFIFPFMSCMLLFFKLIIFSLSIWLRYFPYPLPFRPVRPLCNRSICLGILSFLLN